MIPDKNVESTDHQKIIPKSEKDEFSKAYMNWLIKELECVRINIKHHPRQLTFPDYPRRLTFPDWRKMNNQLNIDNNGIHQQLLAYRNLLAPGFAIDVKLQILDDGSFELFFATGDNLDRTVGYWARDTISTKSNCKSLTISLVSKCIEQYNYGTIGGL